MPNRFTIKEHDALYKFIAARDGEYCIKCHTKPLPDKPLQIDHADNDRSNWDPENLHLACQTHNLEFRGMTVKEHMEQIQHYSASNERERARERGREGTNMVKDLVDYRNASPEMKANSYYEIQYRDWILTTVKVNGLITKEEALNSGSEVVGCSQLSASRYLAKLTSGVGVLKQFKDASGTVVISYK
jgi:hypothetical protein